METQGAEAQLNFSNCEYATDGDCFCPRCVKRKPPLNGEYYTDVFGVCGPCAYCNEQGFPTPMYEGECAAGISEEEYRKEHN